MKSLSTVAKCIAEKSRFERGVAQPFADGGCRPRGARRERGENARKEVMREFGNVPLIEDVTSERWRWMLLEQGDCRICGMHCARWVGIVGLPWSRC